MEQLLETIRAATVPDASDDAKAAGAAACRTLLTALEAKAGEPLAAPIAPVAPSSPLQAIVGALKTMTPEQLMDLAIARLKAALPAGTEIARAAAARSARPHSSPEHAMNAGATNPFADIMCADDVAAWLKVDRKTVYNAASRGKIPHQRLGKRLLFSRTALLSWLAGQ